MCYQASLHVAWEVIMNRFNRMHSVFIGALYGLPFDLEMLIESHGQSEKNMAARNLSYAELIARFKVITKDFPRDGVDYEDDHFKQAFTDLPYPIIERALRTLVSNGIRNIWKQHQVDEQYLPVVMQIIKTFPEIIDITPIGPEAARLQLQSSFKLFGSINSTVNDSILSKIEKSANRLVNNYDGRFDNLPKPYAQCFLKKYAHIKAIAFKKRQAALFEKADKA